jgi:ribosomal RNA-processing protein 17
MEEDSAILERKTGHVKKRALKNKALGITFDEKDLKDFVTGFHKRKKKRRKVAQKQQEDAKRRKRNEERLKVATYTLLFCWNIHNLIIFQD